ncbi:hypothetical protein DIPPA_19456 [Diplonema papillatum]|nr:hypothetical protein DIPPA_19456 [Diplonema papillatum]
MDSRPAAAAAESPSRSNAVPASSTSPPAASRQTRRAAAKQPPASWLPKLRTLAGQHPRAPPPTRTTPPTTSPMQSRGPLNTTLVGSTAAPNGAPAASSSAGQGSPSSERCTRTHQAAASAAQPNATSPAVAPCDRNTPVVPANDARMWSASICTVRTAASGLTTAGSHSTGSPSTAKWTTAISLASQSRSTSHLPRPFACWIRASVSADSSCSLWRAVSQRARRRRSFARAACRAESCCSERARSRVFCAMLASSACCFRSTSGVADWLVGPFSTRTTRVSSVCVLSRHRFTRRSALVLSCVGGGAVSTSLRACLQPARPASSPSSATCSSTRSRVSGSSNCSDRRRSARASFSARSSLAKPAVSTRACGLRKDIAHSPLPTVVSPPFLCATIIHMRGVVVINFRFRRVCAGFFGPKRLVGPFSTRTTR